MRTSVQPKNYTLSKNSKELSINPDRSESISTLYKDEFNNFILGNPQVTTVNINTMTEIEEGLESLNITKICFFSSEFSKFKLPKLPPQFKNLKELEIHTCGMSEIFPISGFSKLEKLTIIECGGLKEIPSLSDLKNLKEINISACYSFKNIPDTSECPKLEKLILSGNNTLKTIPSLLSNANLKVVDLWGCDEINFTEELRVELQTLQQRGCKVIYPEKEYQMRIQAHSNPSSNLQQNPASQTDEQIRSAGADIHASASGDQEAGSRDINASAPDDTRARRGLNTLTEFVTSQIRSVLGVNPANLRRPVTRNEARIDPDASGVASQPSRTPNNRGPRQSGNQGNDNNLR